MDKISEIYMYIIKWMLRIRGITIYRKIEKAITKITIFRKVWDKYGKVDCGQGCKLPALNKNPGKILPYLEISSGILESEF